MKTIIVHETDEHILEVLTLALEIENYKVYLVKDCEANFLAIIKQVNPDVVILDYRLDGKKSIEILKTIKGPYQMLPVIAISCNNNINTVAYALGFDGYIEKPFDLDLLYRVLRSHIHEFDSQC